MRVLFICASNVFRSQMAEQIFRTTFGPQPKVSSAGLLQHHVGKQIRPLYPPEEVKILHNHGVAVPSGRSRLVHASDVMASDYVFVMEDWMKLLLAERFPQFDGRVFLLRKFAGYSGNPEIHDIGILTPARVMTPYRQIEASIKRIKQRKLLQKDKWIHGKSS